VLKIPDHFGKRLPLDVVSLYRGALVLAACIACDKSPIDWRGDAREVATPAAGDEGAAPVDVHLVLHPDGSPSLELTPSIVAAPADTAACPASLRVSRLSSTEVYSVWWSRRAGGRAFLVSARSDDAGGTWTPPVPVDTTDRSAVGCSRPAPAIAADGSSGYVHVTYFINSAGGPGVFFAHSMERGEMFHAPVPIMYGDRPSATAVAAADSDVVVAFEDPNSERSEIALAMSHTWGHIFLKDRPDASGGTPIAERPLVALRQRLVAVGWHGKDRAVVARVGTLK
jgi:hypothetical protein